MTTVVYGDPTPRSLLERFITLPLLLFGLFLITLPSFVLRREFSVVWVGERGGRLNREDHDQFPTRAIFGGPHVQSLANSTELQFSGKQFDGLRHVVEKQSRILEMLVDRLEGGGKGKALGAASYL